ncbi:DUF5801 repeats-in-toxin domain-containing protein [Microvirga subterranea]|uniref:DUF5801 domain-containing protein n=1 Tax=Microvirga subterranea TaxID=186651 RepID=A0A370HJ52_9HYPH|nr:DUF5801 repeats-in-toxin domain-containing protein [Microvirga subterranea]RDI58612.1 hypothetical protein DES45_105135 [Microvirga subterranea]
MAITLDNAQTTITGDLTIDEDGGLAPPLNTGVSGDGSSGTDGDDDVLAPNTDFQTYLASLSVVPASSEFPQYARDAITGFKTNATEFSLTLANGAPYPADGIDSGLTTLTGQSIILFGDAGGDAVIGRVGGANGPIAFVIYLDETPDTGVITSATLEIAMYMPVQHPKEGLIDGSDVVDLSGKVYLTETYPVVVIDTFNNLEDVTPGNNTWALVAPDGFVEGPDPVDIAPRALLVTADNGLTVNVSTQGFAVGNQSIDPVSPGGNPVNELLRVDFVTSADVDYQPNEANTAANIAYDKHQEDVYTAGFTLSQVQGGPVDLTVAAYNVTNDAKGTTFLSEANADSNQQSRTITFVEIKDTLTNQVVEVWQVIGGVPTNTTNLSGASVLFNPDGSVTLKDMLVNYAVTFKTAGTAGTNFDRFTIDNIETGNGKFDVKNIFYVNERTEITSKTAELGSHIDFQDDGPQILSGTSDAALGVDDTTLNVDAKDDFSGLFSVDFGSDGPGTIKEYSLSVTASQTNLEAKLTKDGAVETIYLFEKDGTIEGRVGGAAGTVAFVLSVDSATGEVTLDQKIALYHNPSVDADDVETMTAGLIGLTLKVTDGDKDPVQRTEDISGRLSFADDGPSIAADGSATAITRDETTDLGQEAKTQLASLFAPVFGNDGEGHVSYKLTAVDSQVSTIKDTATGAFVTIKVVSDTEVQGVVNDGGTEKVVFSFSIDAATGELTFVQERAIVHPNVGDGNNPTYGDEPLTLPADLVKVEATVHDRDTDHASVAASISDLVTIKDDRPDVGDAQQWITDFVADTSPSVTGNVGGTCFGSDGPGAIKITSVSGSTNLSEFTQVPSNDGNTVTFEKGGEAWFKFELNAQTGQFDFTVLKSGTATLENLNFKIKAGPPVETLSVPTAFNNAAIKFDGVIYKGTGINNFDNSTTKNVDDINPDNLGFGIMGSNPNQASQINNNEGFVAAMGEDTDIFNFQVQGIGNNAKSVHLEYYLVQDVNDNGKYDVGTDQIVKQSASGGDVISIASGNVATKVELNATSDFDLVFARFFFTNTDLQNGALSGNQLRQAIDNAGVRLQNFQIKTADTIPEYDFSFGITKTDKEGDYDTTTVAIHVDPDYAQGTALGPNAVPVI